MSLLPVFQMLNGTDRQKQTVNPSIAFPMLVFSANRNLLLSNTMAKTKP